MMDKKLFSRNWIYENLFNMNEEDYLQEQDRVIADTKYDFRIEQIKTEGNDPIKTGMSFGTPHDIANLYKGDGGVPKGYDEKEPAPKGGWPGAGRPVESGTYGTHEHPMGYDPLGNKGNRKVYESNKANKSLALSLVKQMSIKKTLLKEDSETIAKEDGLLSEGNLLDI